MYTYDRLCELCRYDNNDSDIAHYLLNHLDSLEGLTLSKLIKDTGISKASIHRFYNKGGYVNFKDLASSLNDEIRQKQLIDTDYEKYKENMADCIKKINFNNQQIKLLINKLKNAKKVVFYGNTLEISCLQSLQFYLFTHHIDIIYLDRWDLKSCYQILNSLSKEDVFIMVESSWHIRLLYENSIVNTHILNLDLINELPFHKFYIGKAEYDQYLTFYNINIFHDYDDISSIVLRLLDQKIKSML